LAQTYSDAGDTINLPNRRQENAEGCPGFLPIGTVFLSMVLGRINRIAKGPLAV